MVKEKRQVNVKSSSEERIEALLRIPIALVSGIIWGLWSYLIVILVIINWFMTLFTGERNKSLALFCEYFNTETYKLSRYLTFMSNVRPFPFTSIEWISKFG
jgi:hypothetical protein